MRTASTSSHARRRSSSPARPGSWRPASSAPTAWGGSGSAQRSHLSDDSRARARGASSSCSTSCASRSPASRGTPTATRTRRANADSVLLCDSSQPLDVMSVDALTLTRRSQTASETRRSASKLTRTCARAPAGSTAPSTSARPHSPSTSSSTRAAPTCGSTPTALARASPSGTPRPHRPPSRRPPCRGASATAAASRRATSTRTRSRSAATTSTTQSLRPPARSTRPSRTTQSVACLVSASVRSAQAGASLLPLHLAAHARAPVPPPRGARSDPSLLARPRLSSSSSSLVLIGLFAYSYAPWFERLISSGELAEQYFSLYLVRASDVTTEGEGSLPGAQMCIGCVDSSKYTGEMCVPRAWSSFPSSFPSSRAGADAPFFVARSNWLPVQSEGFWAVDMDGIEINGTVVEGTAVRAAIDSGTTRVLSLARLPLSLPLVFPSRSSALALSHAHWNVD